MVHPTSLSLMLHLMKFSLSLLDSCENNTIMQSVGLTLPELNQGWLDNVASPTQKKTNQTNCNKHWKVTIKNKTKHMNIMTDRITAVNRNIIQL